MDDQKIGCDYRYIFILIPIILLAAVPRFAGLQEIPGLDHDEALICLGARSIADGGCYPLTGDKAYEGPLLEYLLSIPMLGKSPSEYPARLFMAVCGILAVYATFYAGRMIWNIPTGLFASSLMAISLWHLASSRVIYTCNLSQLLLPVFIAELAVFERTARNFRLFLSGFILGLAANGRLTALILVLPTLILIPAVAGGKKTLRFIGFISCSVIPLAPLLYYNAMNQWPVLSILSGSGQSHLIPETGNLLPRWIGFAVTLFDAISGNRFWLDVETGVWLTGLVPVAMLLAGLATCFQLRIPGKNIRIWLAGALLMLMLFVPIVTKTLNEAGRPTLYHPHYLDLVMPFVILLGGMGLNRIWSKHRFVSILLLFLCVSSQGYLLSERIIPVFKQNGLPGRWDGRAGRTADCIRKITMPANCRIVVPWQFGSGYPQLLFLLREYTLIPVIDRYYGAPKDHSREAGEQVVFVQPMITLRNPPWKPLECVSSNGPILDLFTTRSPGYFIEGKWTGSDGSVLLIRSEVSDSSQKTDPDLLLVHSGQERRLTMMNREDLQGPHPLVDLGAIHVTPRHRAELRTLAKTVIAHRLTGVCKTGNSERWEFIWSNEPADGKTSLSVLIHNDVGMEGKWSGTSIFY